MHADTTGKDLFTRSALRVAGLHFAFAAVSGGGMWAVYSFFFGSMSSFLSGLMAVAPWFGLFCLYNGYGQAGNRLHGELMTIFHDYIENEKLETERLLDKKAPELDTRWFVERVHSAAVKRTKESMKNRFFGAVDRDWQIGWIERQF